MSALKLFSFLSETISSDAKMVQCNHVSSDIFSNDNYTIDL